MGNQDAIDLLGMTASIILPFFNVPLIIRMIQRKSSSDISLVWTWGVFVCLWGIQPAAWRSADLIFKIFNTTNVVLYSGVTFVVVYYRWRK